MWIGGTLRVSGEQRCRIHFDFSIFVNAAAVVRAPAMHRRD
jgi:hypothetical protein